MPHRHNAERLPPPEPASHSSKSVLTFRCIPDTRLIIFIYDFFCEAPKTVNERPDKLHNERCKSGATYYKLTYKQNLKNLPLNWKVRVIRARKDLRSLVQLPVQSNTDSDTKPSCSRLCSHGSWKPPRTEAGHTGQPAPLFDWENPLEPFLFQFTSIGLLIPPCTAVKSLTRSSWSPPCRYSKAAITTSCFL